MGILDAAFDAFSGTLADQWKDIVTVGEFDERTAVAPGVRKRNNEGYGYNQGQSNILSNGSIIYVPENTAAFIFSQSGIENVITKPGGYEYRDGQLSVFDKQSRDESGIVKTLFNQTAQRIGFSGMSADDKRVSFVNLRELRGIKFGTRGPLAYNDLYYETDLEVYAYGLFSIKIVEPVAFVRNFLPANVGSYSFNDLESRSQLVAEFLHSFIVALNSLSTEYRISQLPSQAGKIVDQIRSEGENAGTWKQRFGIELCGVAIENIEFSDDSRELVRNYSEKKMSVRAYEGVSAQAGNMAAQQMIAEGVRENGLGDGGNMLFGLGLAGSLNPQNASQATGATVPDQNSDTRPAATSVDDQVETLKKLKELVDMGILTPDEFTAKKKQLLGL